MVEVEVNSRSIAMIELTEIQQRAIDMQEQPPVVVDPRTGQVPADPPGRIRNRAQHPEALRPRMG